MDTKSRLPMDLFTFKKNLKERINLMRVESISPNKTRQACLKEN